LHGVGILPLKNHIVACVQRLLYVYIALQLFLYAVMTVYWLLCAIKWRYNSLQTNICTYQIFRLL